MSTQARHPDKVFSTGSIRASIWKNEVEQDGRTSVRHSIKIEKQFRDSDGNWQDTDHFFPGELPKLAVLAMKAYSFIHLRTDDESDPST